MIMNGSGVHHGVVTINIESRDFGCIEWETTGNNPTIVLNSGRSQSGPGAVEVNQVVVIGHQVGGCGGRIGWRSTALCLIANPDFLRVVHQNRNAYSDDVFSNYQCGYVNWRWANQSARIESAVGVTAALPDFNRHIG